MSDHAQVMGPSSRMATPCMLPGTSCHVLLLFPNLRLHILVCRICLLSVCSIQTRRLRRNCRHAWTVPAGSVVWLRCSCNQGLLSDKLKRCLSPREQPSWPWEWSSRPLPLTVALAPMLASFIPAAHPVLWASAHAPPSAQTFSCLLSPF